MGDAEHLQRLIGTWQQAVADVVALLRSLSADEWDLPTDLPGWSVRSVAAHLAHLESELAGVPQEQVDVPDAPHLTSPMSRFTEAGPLARATWPVERIVDELETSAATRLVALRADPPTDASATAAGFAGALGWSWGTLLSNRCVDVWMHDQDVRRAVARPGGLDTPAAAHVADTFTAALPFVVGKRVAPPPGTTVVLEVTGAQSRTVAAAVGEDRRAHPVAPPDDPTTRLALDFETYAVLAGGRQSPEVRRVDVSGDEDLGRRVAAALAVTP